MKVGHANQTAEGVRSWCKFLASAAAVLLTSACTGEQAPIALTEFKAEIRTIEPSKIVRAGEYASTELDVKNTSSQTWPPKGKNDKSATHAVHLSYHLLDSDKKVIEYDGVRTPLPRAVKPNETVRITARFNAPSNPGDYIVRFTMVQELVSWFDSVSPSSATDLPLKVGAK